MTPTLAEAAPADTTSNTAPQATAEVAGNPAQKKKLRKRHAIAMHGDPALAPGFKHFPYADPKAPKGGALRLALFGSFDSLNPFIIKGVAAAGLRDYVYESLLTRGLDEPFTLYAGIAEAVTMPEQRTSITFHLHPEAAFSDGHPIDADDIIFSHATLRDRGRPNHRAYYKKVKKVEKLDERTVRFQLGDGADRELPLILGLMPVLPSHRLTPETFEKTTLQAPVGSGPYRVLKVDAGRSVTYALNPDWWASDLPVNRGRFNFATVRYDYYRDGSALFEAFKSRQFDVLKEESPTQWAEGYDIDAVRDGRLIKRSFDIGLPAGMTAFTMNTRRPPFDDVNVRKALIALFDFGWVNKNLFHGLYTRTQSYFARSELSSHGHPADAKERRLLAPFAAEVDPEILNGTYALPVSDGSGRNRKAWRRALKLLGKAGYKLTGGVLRNTATGAPLRFEMLAASNAQQRLFLAYARDLKRLGINASVRLVDSAQFQSRLTSYDYDMIQTRWPASLSPGNEQIFRWSAQMADREGSFNFAGVKSPAVDAMITALLAAHGREDFRSAVRALDRVLLSGRYVIPLFHLKQQWVAHWDTIVPPENTPLFGYQIDTWWAASAKPRS